MLWWALPSGKGCVRWLATTLSAKFNLPSKFSDLFAGDSLALKNFQCLAALTLLEGW